MLSRKEKAGLAVLAVAVISVVAVPMLARAKTESGTVVAIVNGNKIFKSDVEDVLKQNKISSADMNKVFPIVVNQMINEKLISEAARKSNTERTSEYRHKLALLKKQLVKQIYLENYLKKEVTDSAVQKTYDSLKAANEGKYEVHARHIVVKTKAEAEKIIQQLNHGANFTELAKEDSTDHASAANGGDIGWFTDGQLPPQFDAFTKASFSLKPGTYSQTPVETSMGWHVIYVVSKRKVKMPSLEDAELAIRRSLGQRAVQKLVLKLRSKAEIKQFDMNGRPERSPKKG